MSSRVFFLVAFVPSRRISVSECVTALGVRMQAVQQFPKFGECARRRHRRANGKVETLHRVGNPRRESADSAVGQLAEKVLTFRELRPPFNAKALAVQWVKWVMNLDDFGTMGIMFLARAARAKVIWPKLSDMLPSNRAIASGTGKHTYYWKTSLKLWWRTGAGSSWNRLPRFLC